MQFESLLSNVAPLLDAEGFKRRSEAFYKTVAGRNMHLIIDFQRSASHDYDQLKFTINLGFMQTHLGQGPQAAFDLGCPNPREDWIPVTSATRRLVDPH
jgi:hypothetical protein